ncbi:ankyrin repeat-containing protein At2g01680-like [Pistacia vera]|uniref:ankyrin repeat-containing protein At2g01680-like n=1 Tax=Pistacia vera TaxID=55513 RepID=UPI001263BC26|nr:ankyrin repeat-containing protein At2g01680-like [Pistacia vera]XP_031275936.1 ankyrin repeat-containing protein At2g01680-like [Pistacia vera]
MDSVSTVNEEAASGTRCEFNQRLHKAAAKGDIQPFTENNQRLDLIVTPIKNTILHIHIISPIRTPKSTEFVTQILDKCSSLLLQVNANGDTPLHVAARYGHSGIVKVLIERAKSQNDDLESGLGAEGSKQLMLRMSNKKGNSALHEAVRNDHIDVVKILTKEDQEFSHYANDLGETPLFIAAERGCLLSLTKILKRCKSAAPEGPYGRTALHVAAMKYHLGITKELLMKRKSLATEIDQYGWTPLHYAAYYGCFDIAMLLLHSDTSAAYVGDKERMMTPLHMAVSQTHPYPGWAPKSHRAQHAKIITEIISRCPDCCEMVDSQGWNVLHFAMTKLTVKQLNTLLRNSILRDLIIEKDTKGNNPINVLAACRPRVIPKILKSFTGVRYRYANNNKAYYLDGVQETEHLQLQQEILKLSTFNGIGPYRHGIIRKDSKWIFEMLPRYEKTTDTEMVVAALIATVTFTAALTMPGGYKSETGTDQGTALLSKKAAFKAFIITDAMAMVFSLLAVSLHFYSSWNLHKHWQYRKQTRPIITCAIMSMVVAFSTGTYAVLSPSLGISIATCLVGLSFFVLFICIDIRLTRKGVRINRA